MIDSTAFIAPGAVVVGAVTIGTESSIWYNSVVRGDMAPVSLGDQTTIQDLAVLHVDEGLRLGRPLVLAVDPIEIVRP